MIDKPNTPACPLSDASDDDRVKCLLERTRVIAVVGMSSRPHRPSYEVGMYLRAAGYEIVPVHPREKEIEGMPVYPNLDAIPDGGRIELVDLFVSGEKTVSVVEAAARLGVRAVWFQPGAEYEPAARRAAELGLEVVGGRCTMADHRRLFR